MEFQYRCILADDSGGRCPNPAVEVLLDEATGETEERFCRTCIERENTREAPRPDAILVKFFLGEADTDIIERIRTLVPQQKRDEKAIRERHAQQEQARYGGARFKKGPHSGSPVFRQGGIDGLRKVTLPGLFDEMRRDGYRLESVVWFSSGPATVLQFSFRKDASEAGLEAELSNITRELVNSSIAECYIWANAPKEDGTVVHTVNLKGSRDPDGRFAAYELLFVHGDWYVDRVSV